MTIETFVQKAIQHNTSIDHFTQVELPKHFGGNKVTLSRWFEAQRLINEQNFYDKGMVILKEARANGIDVKMNMQTYKLIW